MKKFIFMLVVMTAVVVPIGVNAFSASLVAKENNIVCDEESNICTGTADFYMVPNNGESLDFTDNMDIKGTVKEGRLVKSVRISKTGDNFDFAITGDLADNEATLVTKEAEHTVTGEEYIGTIEWTFENEENRTTEDCSVIITLNDVTVTVEPEPNPETGIELPYIILGLAAVAGIGVYMVTRKNNKLFNV